MASKDKKLENSAAWQITQNLVEGVDKPSTITPPRILCGSSGCCQCGDFTRDNYCND